MQKIEEMRITIEDLEALKELNDELEENHAETEKQLHEDLGMFGFWFLFYSIDVIAVIRGKRVADT